MVERNRSVPANIGLSHVLYRELAEALAWPTMLGFGTQSLVNDGASIEPAGAHIREDFRATPYGERQRHWLRSQYARSGSPENWGATVAPR